MVGSGSLGTGQSGRAVVHAQVEGSEVNVGFEWGNEGSLSVDAKAHAATNGAPPAESVVESPVQYSQHVCSSIDSLQRFFTRQKPFAVPSDMTRVLLAVAVREGAMPLALCAS